ncbi:MAG: D-aminoacylase [Candidatus Aminicenantes bacterium]|nr:D-aminoacylase [Candidatus Aminicenantes bacterium]
MKTTSAAAAVGLGGCGLLLKGCSKGKNYAVVIKDGLIYDGRGGEPFLADIAISGGIIQEVGRISASHGKTVIDASGLSVCPGFIDVHDHSDAGLLVNPKAESAIRQGITTIISGNCGSSPFPIAEEIVEEVKSDYKEEYGLDLNWSDLNSFFSRLEEKRIAINYGTLIGHGSVRGAVVGFNDRPSKREELLQMKSVVAQYMKDGALGLSTGLEYAPGSYAPAEEIEQLCYDVAQAGGVYATHMRSEGEFLLESLDESIDVSRKTGVSLQISHFKVAYPENWNKVDDAIARVEQAAAAGIPIFCDRYPYIAGSTGLSFYMPLWAKQGTTDEFLSRLKDPTLETRLRDYVMEQERKLQSWNRVVITDVVTEANKMFIGKSILEAQKETGKDAFEFIRDILIAERARVGMVIFMMDEDNLKKILAHPLVGIGCDGSALAPYGPLGEGKPHPRSYGTFPRVLGKYVRDEKILPMEKMIQKITALPAAKFGLGRRGTLLPEYAGDIVVFDEKTVLDVATYEDPHRYPRGIVHVLVNGQPTVTNGNHTGVLDGRVLRKKT